MPLALALLQLALAGFADVVFDFGFGCDVPMTYERCGYWYLVGQELVPRKQQQKLSCMSRVPRLWRTVASAAPSLAERIQIDVHVRDFLRNES